MIAIAHALVATPVRAGASALALFPINGELVRGERVEVAYTVPADHPQAEIRGWSLIRSRARTGWVAPGTIKRQPIYMIDASHHNGAMPDWHAAYEAVDVIGVKISEGINYQYAAWGRKNWGLVRAAAGDRYGVSKFRLAYHWARCKDDPAKQVDYMLSIIDASGGWGPGDLIPVCDLERGGNEGVTAAEVRAWVRAFTAHMFAVTGWATLLYAGSFPRDLGIHDLNTCGGRGLWPAEYGPVLKPQMYGDLGYHFEADDVASTLFGWQYAAGVPSGAHDIHGNLLPLVAGYDNSIVFCDGYDVLKQRWGAAPRHR